MTGDAVPDLENSIVISNHQQMPDIIAIMALAWRKKRLGDLKWFVKDILKYVPGVGWGMLFLDCLFVKRSWESDENRLHSIFSKFLREKIPIWLVSFSEGTRFTPAKLVRSQEYARKMGWPEPRHVLVPRTKGIVASVRGLRGHIQAVYDITIGYPAGIPTLWQFAQGYVRCVHLRVRRFPVEELPRDPEAMSTWLRARFEEKDGLMAHFLEHSEFPD
jgi:1-acyl-sn-glycerol-3-phosphate acyltransferase